MPKVSLRPAPYVSPPTLLAHIPTVRSRVGPLSAPPGTVTAAPSPPDATPVVFRTGSALSALSKQFSRSRWNNPFAKSASQMLLGRATVAVKGCVSLWVRVSVSQSLSPPSPCSVAGAVAKQLWDSAKDLLSAVRRSRSRSGDCAP